MIIHTGEKPNVHSKKKPHMCSLCGKSFSRLGDLKLYKKRHSGVKNRFAFSVGRFLRQILKWNGTREFTLEKKLAIVHTVTRDSIGQEI